MVLVAVGQAGLTVFLDVVIGHPAGTAAFGLERAKGRRLDDVSEIDCFLKEN